MLFLNPLLLWFLAAASIPVVIHLLNRRRHKTIHWAAMQFLLKATRESRGKKKLRHFLILACRTLGLAALIFAAARPIVSGLLGLPSNAATALIIGFLRKDVGIGMFAPLDMTASQLVVASVVLALYFPCVATWPCRSCRTGCRGSRWWGGSGP